MEKGNMKVLVAMGSGSDLPVMKESAEILKHFEVDFDVIVTSAHRSPQKTTEYAQSAEEKGYEVIIVGAGHAAHLAGVFAAYTNLPVIGVPIDSSALKGLDSLFSTVQMPGGVPVATMAIGTHGAKNAGIFAVQILALKNSELKQKLNDYKTELAAKVQKLSREFLF